MSPMVMPTAPTMETGRCAGGSSRCCCRIHLTGWTCCFRHLVLPTVRTCSAWTVQTDSLAPYPWLSRRPCSIQVVSGKSLFSTSAPALLIVMISVIDCVQSQVFIRAGAGSTVRGARSLLSPQLNGAAVNSGGDTAMADAAAPADDNAEDDVLPNGVEDQDPRRAVARLAADAAARRAAQAASPATAALVAADAHAALGEDNTAASWKEAARQEAGKADPAALNRCRLCHRAYAHLSL